MTKRKLFIIFDFNNWIEARSWSYISSYLIFEELSRVSQGEAELLSIPYDYSESKVMEILTLYIESGFYDHLVIWVPHLKICKHIGEAIRKNSVIITYFITESLVYTEQEINILPHLKYRMQEFLQHYVTHSTVFCFCKESHENLKKNGVNSKFYYGYYPKYKIINERKTTLNNKIISCAANLYNEERINIHNSISKLLVEEHGYKNIKIIDKSQMIEKFDDKMNEIRELDIKINFLPNYFIARLNKSVEIMHIRRIIWIDYLELLKECDFIINLPSYFKGLPGRVIESLCIAVPCISIQSNLSREQQLELEQNGVMKNIDINNFNLNSLVNGNKKNQYFIDKHFLSLDKLISELECMK